MQRAIVAWHASRAKGHATDPGFGGGGVSKEGTEWKPVRPACESWVVNRHMKLALTLMRRLAKGTEEGLTMSAVEERVAKCDAATERAAARAKEKAETFSRAERDERAKISEASAAAAGGVAAPEETAQGTGEASVA